MKPRGIRIERDTAKVVLERGSSDTSRLVVLNLTMVTPRFADFSLIWLLTHLAGWRALAKYRMEHAGWLVSSWGESETKRKSKFYRLTKGGRKRLQTELKRWERISLAIASALRAT